MRRPTRLAAVLAALLVGGATAAGSASALASAAAAATPATPAPGDQASATTLLTGERVLVRHLPDGRPLVQVTTPYGAPAGAGAYSQTTVAGHTYVVPSAARALVGTVLDPSLFDVDVLAATHEVVPVTVTSAGPLGALPGVQVTGRSGATATGTLTVTPQVADAWRRALVSATTQAQAQHRAPTSLFGVVTAMSAQQPAATGGAATPSYAQLTLGVRVLGTDGLPEGFGEVALVNTDDSSRYFRYVITAGSATRISVPAGHYAAVAQVDEYDDSGLVASRLVVVNDYTVSTDQQMLTLDARKATASPSLTTPRPATIVNRTVEVNRLSAVGRPMLTWAATVPASVPLLVSPTPAVKVGALDVVTNIDALGTATTPRPYSYSLAFVDSGRIPASLAKTVRPAQLADVRSTYVTDKTRSVSKSRTPIFLFEASVGSHTTDFTVPAVRDEYTFAPVGTRWSDTYNANQSDANYYAGTTFDVLRTYPAGAVTPITWLRGPLAPGVPEDADADPTYTCPECRTATAMSVELAHLVDTTPGHAGFAQSGDPSVVHTHFALTANGQLLAGGDNQFGATVTVPRASTRYRMHLDVDRSDQDTTTSTQTSTDVTFTSAALGGGALPSTWGCRLAGTCSVVPMLTSSVPLPTDLLGRLPVGSSSFPLHVGSFAGAPALTVDGAALEASVDGTTWTLVPLTRTGSGSYTATLTNPSAWAGKPVSLRLSATATDGSTLVQTTTAAYVVAAA